MRLSFPNGEHADVIVAQGEVRLGAAADNRVAIAQAGLAEHHACFVVDPQRGILLRLLPGSNGAHVNARPVRKLALLRLGDVVSLGELQVLVKPDSDADVQSDVPADPPAAVDAAQRTAASRVVLRGVGGPLFGRSFPLDAPLVIGRGSDADIRLDDPALAEHHARLEHHSDRVVLRDLGSAEGSVVNGIPVRSAVLHPGDQLAVEHYRFVLEAPGLPVRGSAAFDSSPRSGGGITQTMRAVEVGAAAPAAAGDPGRGNIWWLIGAALLIMVALAALLFYAPQMV
jgi:pSer/pThr/pTyr-binding forkhead associated (FHA) protein